MKTYIITADEVRPLKTEITAKDENDALRQLEKLLDSGDMPEESIGYIANKKAYEI